MLTKKAAYAILQNTPSYIAGNAVFDFTDPADARSILGTVDFSYPGKKNGEWLDSSLEEFADEYGLRTVEVKFHDKPIEDEPVEIVYHKAQKAVFAPYLVNKKPTWQIGSIPFPTSQHIILGVAHKSPSNTVARNKILARILPTLGLQPFDYNKVRIDDEAFFLQGEIYDDFFIEMFIDVSKSAYRIYWAVRPNQNEANIAFVYDNFFEAFYKLKFLAPIYKWTDEEENAFRQFTLARAS